MQTFTDRLIAAIRKKRSILCVGIDPQLQYLPPHLLADARRRWGPTHEAVGWAFTAFSQRIIDAIAPDVIAVKPQSAFFEQHGHYGIRALEATIERAHQQGLEVILDAKRGDGGDTAQAYAGAYVGEVPFWGQNDGELATAPSPLRVDALTVQPQIGSACVTHFVDQVKKSGTGIFLVTKTSFKPNSEVEQIVSVSGVPVWQEMAKLAGKWGEGTEGESGWSNVGVVMGATYPDDASKMRELLPKACFLVPGYGAQGGGADDAVIGADKDGLGIVVNTSRGALYAYHPVSKSRFQGPSETYLEATVNAVRAANDELNAALELVGKLNF